MSMRIATAEWANPEQVEESYLFSEGRIWLGRSCSESNLPIGYLDDRHVCLVSGSRGGKGTTSIVNNLLLWPGSLCVIDPKGENATIAAARRGRGSDHAQGLGQEVRVLDPFKAAQVEESFRGRFNPLDALDPADEETVDEAGRIADAIVVIHETNDPFWDESARAMVKGLILHVITAPEFEGRRNLVTLRQLITRGDWEAVAALRQAGDQDIPPAHGLLWTALANNPAFNGLVAGTGDSFTNMLLNSPKQYESVLQVANRNTEFIDSPAMQRCLEASDFRLSDLKTNPPGLSIFLCLPQRYMSTHYRWLRMMIALTITEMEKARGRPATGYPVLMVLDEFAGLKRMEVVENAVAQIAGYGVKMFFALQSLEQLKAVYKDNWETFLANSGLKIFFNLEDYFSRDYVSKLIGETEVIREVRSGSETVGDSESYSRSVARSESHTRGRSTSTGMSDSTGTTESLSSGRSGSASKSTGRSWNWSEGETRKWSPGLIFYKSYEAGASENEGESESLSSGTSTSEGWNAGESRGTSRSTSRSWTDGTSESWTEGTSETEGMTHGTSQSRTAGSSETIQKRALITPDEIGKIFARINDREDSAYPGLALVLISGTPPVALRRVNYYEDEQFKGLFDPHPDHPLIAQPASAVFHVYNDVLLMLDERMNLLTDKRIRLEHIKIGQSFSEYEHIVTMSHGDFPFPNDAHIIPPRAGKMIAYDDDAEGPPAGRVWLTVSLFDGADGEKEWDELHDPLCGLRSVVFDFEDNKERAAKKAFVRAGIASAALMLLTLIGLAGVFGGAKRVLFVLTGIAAAALFIWGWRQTNAMVRHDRAWRDYVERKGIDVERVDRRIESS